MNSGSVTTKIPHPQSTRFFDEDEQYASTDDFPISGAKRRKIAENFYTNSPSHEDRNRWTSGSIHDLKSDRNSSRPFTIKDEIPDSEDEDTLHHQKLPPASQLETALPPVQTDAEAIEAYEAYKAGQAAEALAEGDSLKSRMDNMTWTRGRSSIYVDAFNHALCTVLEDEGHLFNEAEKTVFKYWDELDYESQYLYVRLFLRKTSAWFRIGRLGYYSDISDMANAVTNLQTERPLPTIKAHDTAFPGEAVLPEEAVPLGERFRFAECSDEHINTLDEASSLLFLDELKLLAKEAKVNGKNKRELLHNLRRTSGKQSGLGFMKRSETEESVDSVGTDVVSARGDDDYDLDGAVTPNSRSNRDAHFTKKILDQTGKCIRLSLVPLKLFERVHLVFYRSTEWTEKSLTTLILAKISRRNFPDYIVSRSATIFESRELLLEFEASLRTQFRVDNILEFSNLPVHRQIEEVKTIFDAVYPRWKVLLAKEQEKEERVYETGEGAYLRRFSPAWVYTRIVHKGLWPFARFKDHKREHELLTELLDQHLFHAARRGVWYQRKALLEEHYMYGLTDPEGRSEEANKKHWKRIALQTCEQGLQDNECHVIYHYDLQKRVMKLEKQLRMPKREQHIFGHVGLKNARERDVHGIQIIKDREDTPPAPRPVQRKDSAGGSKERERSPEKKSSSTGNNNTNTNTAPATAVSNRRGAKTLWLDPLDTTHMDYVNVESMCLSHYRAQLGFKGYHSEGGILRMLFGLLFYDVLFTTYAPNVFQTAYQTCPLDLHTDAFYSTRISEINARVNDIANEQGEHILRRTWAEHAERKTCVVGVRWDDYELEDLCELVRCFGGDALGVVMRVMAQEYQDRGGGVPDLILWKRYGEQPEEEREGVGGGIDGSSKRPAVPYGKVMFAEVKSENDRLSDTQRLWISVLLNAGVEVELCHAIASEVRVIQ